MAGGSLYKRINRLIGKAIHRYDMIAPNDRILIGLSGGKDSLTLVHALSERQKRVAVDYHLIPVYIDPGFPGGFSDELYTYMSRTGHSLRIEKTDYGIQAHSDHNRENPCFLCARLRRKRLFEIAHETGCRKIAFGHHKDDMIETLLMNMCYSGEISTMMPSQSLFKGLITIIRPLFMVDEHMIARFAEASGFPKFSNPCPSAGTSKRREIKEMLYQLYRTNRKIKGNLFVSMSRVRPEYLP